MNTRLTLIGGVQAVATNLATKTTFAWAAIGTSIRFSVFAQVGWSDRDAGRLVSFCTSRLPRLPSVPVWAAGFLGRAISVFSRAAEVEEPT